MKTRLVRTLATACFLLLGGFGECGNPDTFSLLSGGYVLVTPPSNLVSPGAVVLMVKDELGRAQMQTLCGPRASLSPHFLARVSETLTATYKMSKKQQFTLQADAVDRFRARAKEERVATVHVELSRPRVIEVEESDIYTHVESRTEACQRAIDSRIDAGFTPTFITSAYIADIQYTVTFQGNRNLTKKVREERMARIAANLGGGHTEITETSVRAQNLVLAIKSDVFPLTIRPTCAQPPRYTPATVNPAIESSLVEVLPTPTAPYVPPAGGWVNPVIGG